MACGLTLHLAKMSLNFPACDMERPRQRRPNSSESILETNTSEREQEEAGEAGGGDTGETGAIPESHSPELSTVCQTEGSWVAGAPHATPITPGRLKSS